MLFANGTVTDLNAPGSGGPDAQANAINNSGVIVGNAVSSVRNATFGYELTTPAVVPGCGSLARAYPGAAGPGPRTQSRSQPL